MDAEVDEREARFAELAALPDEVRERVVWAECEREARYRELEAHDLRRRRRALLETVALFVGGFGLGTGFALDAVLWGVLVGVPVGAVQALWRPGSIAAILLAMPVYMLTLWLYGQVSIPYFLGSPFPFGAVAGLLAFQREDAQLC